MEQGQFGTWSVPKSVNFSMRLCSKSMSLCSKLMPFRHDFCMVFMVVHVMFPWFRLWFPSGFYVTG